MGVIILTLSLLLFIAAFLRFNSPTIQFTPLMCTIQWRLVNFQSCATITIINFIWISHHHHIPSHHHLPAPEKQKSCCLYKFTCSGYLIYMDSYSMWPFVTGFFDLPWCSQGAYMLQCISITLFLYMTVISHFMDIPCNLSLHQLMEFGLFLLLSYYEKCYEHSCTSLDIHVF